MATLEKIRSKSVLLFVVIIVALLAFILGDFMTSGSTYFSDPTTVAKVDGVKVEYQDYQRQISQLNDQLQNTGRSASADAIASQALQNELSRKLMDREYARLGIHVTDNELRDAMFGANAVPQAQQMVAYLSQAIGLSTPDAAAVANAIQSPATYGITADDAAQMRTLWQQMETGIEEGLKDAKFQSLMSGLFTYNNLDARETYNDVAATAMVSYTVLDAAGLPNDSIEFSDADVRALYDSRREEFAISEPKRQIDYIYVPIEPSVADKELADNTVAEAVTGLANTEGLSAVTTNPRFITNTARTSASDIRMPQLREFVTGDSVGAARLITRTGNDYTIAKILGKDTGIDSIEVTAVRMAPGVNAQAIADALAAGTSLEELNSDSVQGMQQWVSLELPDIDSRLHDALATAAIGTPFVYTDTVQGTEYSMVYRVDNRHAPVPFYDYAVITYTVDPSAETISDLSGKLRAYVSNNSSAADFRANAAENGYSVLSDEVGASSVQIGRAEGSRPFIKWAMENGEGKVSPVFQDDRQSYLLALAVADIYEDYRPYNSPLIYTGLQEYARNAKKAKTLAERYAGAANDLQGYAAAFGSEVRNGSVNISNPMLLTLGYAQSELMGAMTAAAPGTLTGPVAGQNNIVVFQVDEINTENRPFSEEQYGMQFLRSYGPLRSPNLLLPLLIGKNKVENRSLNFVSAPAE